MKNTEDTPARLKSALKFIELQRRLMIEAGASEQLTDDLASIIKYLSSMTEHQANFIIRQTPEFVRRQKQKKADEIAKISKLELNEIKNLMQDRLITRSDLELIAVGRFQVPKGSLRSLGNIRQLRDKLETLISNEESHETINKVAREHGGHAVPSQKLDESNKPLK